MNIVFNQFIQMAPGIIALGVLITVVEKIDNILKVINLYNKYKRLILFLKLCYWCFSAIALVCAYRSMQVNDVKIAIIFSLSLFAIILTLLAHGLLIVTEKTKDKKE